MEVEDAGGLELEVVRAELRTAQSQLAERNQTILQLQQTLDSKNKEIEEAKATLAKEKELNRHFVAETVKAEKALSKFTGMKVDAQEQADALMEGTQVEWTTAAKGRRGGKRI